MKTLPSLPFSGVSTSCPHAPWVVRGWAPRLTATLAWLAGNVAFAANSPNIEAKVAMCIGCHGIPGYQASFPEVHKVPMISGQNARYIAAAVPTDEGVVLIHDLPAFLSQDEVECLDRALADAQAGCGV